MFPSQICVGAVQRPFLADLWPCDPGPPLLPAHPFCGAQSNVQLHYDHVVTLADEELRAEPYQGTNRGEWRKSGSENNPTDNYSAGLYMYASYSAGDLGRPSLHLRPSTVEENRASGVYNTHSKRKGGGQRRKTEVLTGAVLHPWIHGSSVSMDSASSIIEVSGEVTCIESDGKGLWCSMKWENEFLVLRPLIPCFLWMGLYPNEMPASVLFIVSF